jgi:hypothetical protein
MPPLDRVVALKLSPGMAHQADAAYGREVGTVQTARGNRVFPLVNLTVFSPFLGGFVAVVTRNHSGLSGAFVIGALSGVVLPNQAAC